jgi:hypothetical protein
VWASGGSASIRFFEERSTGGDFDFVTTKNAIVYASGSSYRKGSDVYSNIFVDGYLCARDRGTETSPAASHNFHASSSCMYPVGPGSHRVTITERVIASHVLVLEL